jgi:4-hydroxybenzoyl-CoA thioesterase
MSFVLEMPVRFAHIDAAGIVFYPRYFEMLNATVEEWFAIRTGCGFAELHLERRLGVPTLKLDSRFVAPSRLGDLLAIELIVEQVGRSSCQVQYHITSGGETRVEASAVLVCMNLDTGRSEAWPDDLRAGISTSDPVRIAVAA